MSVKKIIITNNEGYKFIVVKYNTLKCVIFKGNHAKKINFYIRQMEFAVNVAENQNSFDDYNYIQFGVYNHNNKLQLYDTLEDIYTTHRNLLHEVSDMNIFGHRYKTISDFTGYSTKISQGFYMKSDNYFYKQLNFKVEKIDKIDDYLNIQELKNKLDNYFISYGIIKPKPKKSCTIL